MFLAHTGLIQFEPSLIAAAFFAVNLGTNVQMMGDLVTLHPGISGTEDPLR